MSHSEFILEFFSEEIPAKMQAKAGENLERLFKNALSEHCLEFNHLEVFYSPQRLGCMIKGLPKVQADVSEERKGPSRSAPEAALSGFLKSTGLTIEECEWRKTEKGEYLFANIFKKGFPTEKVLAKIIIEIAKEFPWPKSMRWGAHKFRWIRPLHNIMAIFDGSAIEGELNLESTREKKEVLVFNTYTWGHRFLSPERLIIKNYADYLEQLKTHKVILSPESRKNEIKSQIQKICDEHNLTLIKDESLLNEVTGLIEYPNAYLGKIDDTFMSLPPEVMQTSMRENQKYFSLQNKNGNFAPYFIVISNHIPKDNGAEIIHGNQKVLSARLSDAAFFYQQDTKISFQHYREKLKSLIFQDGLGSVHDKTTRVTSLIKQLESSESIQKITEHYKNDLVTGMVGEFPELQGIMGSYYAKLNYFSDEEAQAIYDQYSPAGPNDNCPKNALSIKLGIADRIDTLVGFFGIGIKPTGSKDPYALRRAALSLIRLCVENNYTCNIGSLIDAAMQNYKNAKINLENIKEELLSFISQRFYIYLKDKGYRLELLECLFAQKNHLPLTSVFQKLKTLEATRALPSIAASYKRLNNMLNSEIKKSQVKLHTVDQSLLTESAEKELYKKLKKSNLNDDFEKIISDLIKLTPYINQFLDDVHINVDNQNIKNNRYSLMQSALNSYQQFADFSKIN